MVWKPTISAMCTALSSLRTHSQLSQVDNGGKFG